MNSRNEYLRNIKEESIIKSIEYLSNNSVKKITNKMIVDTIEKLFPVHRDEKNVDRQINVNTLSKQDYYKKNIPKWIASANGIPPNEKALKAAKQAKAKKLKSKLKTLEKYANELISSIESGETECQKLTKKFLRDWIVENKNIELSESIFSTSEEYRNLYKKIESRFLGVYNKNENQVSVSEYGKLKRQLKITNEKLDHFVTNLYVSENNSTKPFVVAEDSYENIFLDKESLHKYFDFMRDKFDNRINANLLFKGIIEECKIREK